MLSRLCSFYLDNPQTRITTAPSRVSVCGCAARKPPKKCALNKLKKPKLLKKLK